VSSHAFLAVLCTAERGREKAKHITSRHRRRKRTIPYMQLLQISVIYISIIPKSLIPYYVPLSQKINLNHVPMSIASHAPHVPPPTAPHPFASARRLRRSRAAGLPRLLVRVAHHPHAPPTPTCTTRTPHRSPPARRA
jgi:hypothetical protein